MNHRDWSWPLAIAVFATLSASPSALLAQPAPTARSSFDAGIAAMENNRYMDAIVALEESYRLRPLPVVLFNLGLAYRAVGREHQAITAFERYLAAPERNPDPGRIAAVEQELGDLRSRACVVVVRAQPANAVVQVDGRPQSALRGEVRVDPGPHVFEVSAEGYRPHREEHTLPARGRLELDVGLDPLPTTPRRALEPGALHTVEPIETNGNYVSDRTPDARPDAPSGRGLSPAFWIGLAVGAAAAATATGLWLDGNAQQRSYDLACRTWPPARDCDGRFQSVQSNLDGRATTVNAVWAVAGVGAVTALLDVVLMALSTPARGAGESPDRARAPRELVRVHVGVDRAAVEVRW